MMTDQPSVLFASSRASSVAGTASALSIRRTLEVVAAMTSRIDPDIRCAILLLEEDHLVKVAEHKLLPEDHLTLRNLNTHPEPDILCHLMDNYGPNVKPLVTQAAECIGAVLFFGLDLGSAPPALDQELEQVCWVATLAIEQKHLTEELTYRAHHEPLTHLWNRIWMEEEIERVLTTPSGSKKSPGLIILGLDRLRIINEVLGHQVGNEVLRQTADRLSRSVSSDCSIARGSGDEFMVLLLGLSSVHHLLYESERLLSCFDLPFQVGEHELTVKASIGSALADASGTHAADLQSKASVALRYAKRKTPGRAASFHSSMITTPPERLAMEQHLRFALEKREFELYYQPQLDCKTQSLMGVEALLRWNHPSLGFISPGVFIPLAEELGIIEEIGDWVIDEAMKQIKRWEADGLHGIRVAVNVSALQFAKPNFSASVANKLHHFKVSPDVFEVEITETMLMTGFENCVRQLKMLRSLGVLIAIDDFGTGHSSLAYLQQLPVQRLKIDRTFVRGIADREERPPLLASIINMAHALNLSVIAEGVETLEQLSALQAMDCGELQGFFFSKPLRPCDLFAWAKERQQATEPIPVEAGQ